MSDSYIRSYFDPLLAFKKCAVLEIQLVKYRINFFLSTGAHVSYNNPHQLNTQVVSSKNSVLESILQAACKEI